MNPMFIRRLFYLYALINRNAQEWMKLYIFGDSNEYYKKWQELIKQYLLEE